MKIFLEDKNMPISTVLNTKIRLTTLCLSGFELYSRWVSLPRGTLVFSKFIQGLQYYFP